MESVSDQFVVFRDLTWANGRWPNTPVRYVEAHAATGWRYVVVATLLPGDAESREGGPVLVTVLHPWQAAYCVQPQGFLTTSYVREKFVPYGREVSDQDLEALAKTIRWVLDRPGE